MKSLSKTALSKVDSSAYLNSYGLLLTKTDSLIVDERKQIAYLPNVFNILQLLQLQKSVVSKCFM